MELIGYVASAAALGVILYSVGFWVIAPSLRAFFTDTFNEVLTPHLMRLQYYAGAVIAVACTAGWQGRRYDYSGSGTTQLWASFPVGIEDLFALVFNSALSVGLVLAVQILFIFFWSFAANVISSKLKLIAKVLESRS